MTHEPIHTVHLTPHITWQGTQAELDAMLAEWWPVGSASEIIAACKRDAAEAKAYAVELEAKLAKAVKALETLKDWPAYQLLSSQEYAHNTLAELKGQDDGKP